MEYGIEKGDVCGRNGCKGIIDEYEKDGCCTCHIVAPCTYCTTPNQYCPECGWDAKNEMDENIRKSEKESSNKESVYVYKTPQELFDELPDGEFGYVHTKVWHSGAEVRGKHNNLTRSEIISRVGCDNEICLPRFKYYDNKEFLLSYFND